MSLHFWTRFAYAFALTISFAGCGFQLRDEVHLPQQLKTIRIEVMDPYSSIASQLEDALKRAGARLASPEETGVAVLRVPMLAETRNPLSVDAAGRTQEYELVYSAEITLTDADGQVVIPTQHIELRRDYLFDTAQAIGSSSEEEIVRIELQREMASAILRRLDAALR